MVTPEKGRRRHALPGQYSKKTNRVIFSGLRDVQPQGKRTMAEKLNKQSIQDWLQKRPGWRVKGQSLVKEFTFGSFRDTIVFVNRIASLADETKHQPNIDIRRNLVRLSLTTPEVDGISQRDLELAQRIDFATSAR
jgi:4a-hydroxytetrahydrobiopterin dehydratase